MIVVEKYGRRLIGETVDVNVTSALQTMPGAMIFARPRRASAHDLGSRHRRRRTRERLGRTEAVDRTGRSTDARLVNRNVRRDAGRSADRHRDRPDFTRSIESLAATAPVAPRNGPRGGRRRDRQASVRHGLEALSSDASPEFSSMTVRAARARLGRPRGDAAGAAGDRVAVGARVVDTIRSPTTRGR